MPAYKFIRMKLFRVQRVKLFIVHGLKFFNQKFTFVRLNCKIQKSIYQIFTILNNLFDPLVYAIKETSFTILNNLFDSRA